MMEDGPRRDFVLQGLASEVPVPEDLSNTEREMLRALAEPGQPLWKIMRSMVDYGVKLREALVSADLTDPAALNSARKVQATIVAVDWVQATFEQALTLIDEEEGKTGS